MHTIKKYKKQIAFLLLTLIFYTAVSNIYTATILIVSIGFHEYSHLFAANILKLETKGFYLIPFVGGVSIISDKYKSLWQQAIVALAGPIGGGLLATLLVVCCSITKISYIGYAAFIMLSLNIFNLAPLSFLDGGQIIDTIIISISEKAGVVWKFISTIAGIVLIWKLNIFIASIITAFALPSAISNLVSIKNQKPTDIVKLSGRQAIIILAIYLSTVCYLFVMAVWTYNIVNINNLIF